MPNHRSERRWYRHGFAPLSQERKLAGHGGGGGHLVTNIGPDSRQSPSVVLTVKARSIVFESIPQYRTSSSITHSSPCSSAETSATYISADSPFERGLMLGSRLGKKVCGGQNPRHRSQRHL